MLKTPGLTIHLLAGVAALGFFAFSEEAQAQSQSEICRGLNTQLAALDLNPRGGGNAGKYRQYSNAIRKQEIQLNRAERAARRYNCVGLFRSRSNRCQQILGTIEQMRSNLITLERTRDQHAPTEIRNSRKRNQIIQALEYNGCHGASAALPPQRKSKRRTLLEQVFGVRTYDERGVRGGVEIDPDSRFQNHFGTFRTLCVRKVDGYYFPISFSTVPERFDADEETCLAMCPNHPMELFVHRMPQEDSEDMVSYRSEIPYREQPFAFAYRKTHNPDVQCRFSVATNAVPSDYSGTRDQSGESRSAPVPTPVFRPDPTMMPAAFDDMLAGLTLAQAKSYLIEKNQPEVSLADREFDPERKIRIVGPAFFPVQ